MNFSRTLISNFFVLLAACYLHTFTACNSGRNNHQPYDSLELKKDLQSPELTAGESMEQMRIEDGFEVKLVAEEPIIVAPVALQFDEKGRIWAVEMQDYMPDTLGTGEERPNGKVVILSDTDGDGKMDKRQVFLDSLVMPRAISFVENGIFVAVPPKLWYYDIVNDQPANRQLVDSAYAEGGNVEHQPNGLLRAIDNWIYSAKSDKRYRKAGNKWLKEQTHFRGQWGITQDDDGRLLYNNNSENLLGDYYLPGLGATNPRQRRVEGFSAKIVKDNRVYPIHPTPGVNRGYLEGILDDSLRLVSFTAACGPVIYNGQLFGSAYYGNAFVAEPAGNLIKRNIITENGNWLTGTQAYESREFLASDDERFRPVNLHVGPDGALYVVDMYRGIIQHKTYLTPYLKNEIKDRDLTKPLMAGRIYKIVPKNKTAPAVTFGRSADSLVALLQHPNGWVRNKAQQFLVDGKMTEAAPALRNLLSNASQPVPAMHALWTLEGLQLLTAADLQPLLDGANWRLKRQALGALPSVLNAGNYKQFADALTKQAATDSLVAPYAGFLAYHISKYNKAAAQNLLNALTRQYANNLLVADAIITNLEKQENIYLKKTLQQFNDSSVAINARLLKVLEDVEKEKTNKNSKELARLYPRGAEIFNTVCQTCHGADGNGITSLAPPLNHSNWVTGDKDKLIAIVLYGMTGPVKVGDKLYKSPEINGDMPAIGQNKEFSNDDIAQLISYIRSMWSNHASKVSASDIQNVRNKYNGRQKTFTMEELNKMK